MKYKILNNEIEITDLPDFDPEKTFECGQCFRWEKEKNGLYAGVAFGKVLRLRKSGSSIFISCSKDDFDNIWRNYFDMDRDYESIRQKLCIDDFMRNCTAFGAGIRILKQDKWEALCSFIISQNNNIPRIKKIIDVLCCDFGEAILFEGNKYYSFPSADSLAVLNADDLFSLRCGYRAAYIINAAKKVATGALSLDTIGELSPADARRVLLALYGVGRKVADCFMLFGLNMLDTFPRDVWISRAIVENFNDDFDPCVFTPYAGIAQQYIFHYIRNK